MFVVNRLWHMFHCRYILWYQYTIFFVFVMIIMMLMMMVAYRMIHFEMDTLLQELEQTEYWL